MTAFQDGHRERSNSGTTGFHPERTHGVPGCPCTASLGALPSRKEVERLRRALFTVTEDLDAEFPPMLGPVEDILGPVRRRALDALRTYSEARPIQANRETR